jgi:Ca-activated chloride channel family protein
LALAAARLRTAEETLRKDYRIKSKVAILLTDGQNNAGKRSPLEAARLAKDWGIKVYAIGIGGRESFVTVRTPLGDYKMPGGPGVDEATLKRIADETGGAFWLAESADKLHQIYREIDRLERTEIESIRHIDYAERFLPFVLIAIALLALEQVLISTIFRRVP